ncbi:MAG TPA: hypothetical protein PL124_06215 [Candidatus Cloacimonadota bacterium]|nr:hypothetical protein [Candidatus Cloacimonadota bacterium]HPS38989.1 hypothetical protein [Candidatus Cloacimonadota bacterium]
MKTVRFARIHCNREALYSVMGNVHPTWIDDEEVLLQLSAFSATLTPRISPA